MDTNYFVCTLGQAAKLEAGRPYRDVNHLVDQLASNSPELPAAGFYTPSQEVSSQWKYHVIDFATVRRVSVLVAELISGKSSIDRGQTVGLLSASSPEFLFVWLALIRLGHPVLLIAPQCSPSAIAHLSKACEAPVLFHDVSHEDLAERAVKASGDVEFDGMQTLRLPFDDESGVFGLMKRQPTEDLQVQSFPETNVAYLHHTSGTSSGVPKPIPQSHKAAVGVLPALAGSKHATFTTTPLYHGGVADLFRAWASSGLIWLFPGQHVPITATNVVKSLYTSIKATQEDGICPVRYFSSVPYVLQLLAQDKEGLQQLQRMDIVGVGGAALPAEVGDRLVTDGVNLVSRYGSAECGFLMSSHREYSKDKEWQYLRRSPQVKQLSFETQEDGLSELVVLDGWPHMAKKNRDNGSYATSDLFASHSIISDAWRYHSRSDSQLTLITGKKFDPAPLEGSIAAASEMLDDVLIFGNGKPYPGVFLFRSIQTKDQADDQLVQAIIPIIDKINVDSQKHTRISRNMLVPMPYSKQPLEKSSKGTVLRGIAEETYKDQIEAAYNMTTPSGRKDVSDNELKDAVLDIVQSVVGASENEQKQLTPETELFAYGVDSVASIQIRHALSQLLPKDSHPLPLSTVEDCGTISRIGDLLLDLRHGKRSTGKDDSRILLQELVQQYGSFDKATSDINGNFEARQSSDDLTVLVTGPTGSLGSHILSQLATEKKVKKIYLLVRGATHHAARERVIKALAQKSLPIPSDFDEKVVILPCKLSEPRLGLADTDYKKLASEIDMVFHLAWSVNFLLSLRSIASTHLVGLKNLLDLALSRKSTPPHFLFCSSVASVSNLLSSPSKIPESTISMNTACGPTGYAQSKLAAEQICSSYAQNTHLANRITILRVGQLSGSSNTGVWNASEAYPLMLSSSKTTSQLPDLGHNEKLNWLPVDIAAKGFIEAALYENKDDGNNTNNHQDPNITSSIADQKVQVLHLLNPSVETTFPSFLQTLKSSGYNFDSVPPTQWLDTLEALEQDDKTKDNPALRLLPFWRQAYGEGRERRETVEGPTSTSTSSDATNKSISINGDVKQKKNDQNENENENYAYEMKTSLVRMPSIKEYIGPLSEAYMLKLWDWIRENID